MSYHNGNQNRPFRIPLPIAPVGLGDVIARATRAIGIKPCPPCKKRQEALNRRIMLGRKRGY